MLFRITIFFSLICFSVVMIGCAALFSEQEWSDNYALLEGTSATSPQMIDGNMNTIGESSFPVEATFGSNPPSEVIITLPEKKVIRRIVIHSDNIKTFDIFADKGGIIVEQDWKLIKDVKSVKTNPIEIPVLVPFPTNRIRVRILSTSDDANLKRRQRARTGGRGFFYGENRRAQAKIREIELYGYKTVEQTRESSAAETREKELDDLLETE
ncbi:MAG: hypothetical protein OXI67_12590 [Candidatus Poribacteria bacterium]|nr:hypothetical protein [Candidatus Poribacteria bacterium]